MIAHPSIAYPSTHLGKRATPATALPPAQACIRCGWCADACPVLLLPQQLYRFARTQELQLAERYQISDCIECGACAAVCPSNIALVQHFHTAKHDLAAAREKRRLAEQAKPRFDFHQARKQEEQAQETLRRQERAALVQTQSAFNSPAQTAAVPVLADHATAPSPQDVIQAALARVNAKKAERKSSDPAAPTTPSQNTENAPS
ncbi:MAG: 4Fe-4S dicluster domain-containing protein [Pseudomonadales bacterium]|nr:4Fe-4S dicluster domain-containing protein [Pseudomonadales bacterium]